MSKKVILAFLLSFPLALSASFVYATTYEGTINGEGTVSSSSLSAPSGFSASQASGELAVNLSWSSVSGATSYKIYRMNSDSSWETASAIASDITGTSYENSGLTSDTYYYRIKAFSSSLESPFSSTATVSVNPVSSGSSSSSSSSSGGGGGGGGGGSYSSSVTTTLTTVSSTLSGEAKSVDSNGDNQINVLDFNTLMINWGSALPGSSADFNKDGTVDIFDFNMLMIYWTI